MSALWILSPVTAAVILAYREKKAAGVTELLKRSFDYRRIRAKVWYVPIVFLMPGVMIVAYGVMRVLGRPLPNPEFPVRMVPGMLVAFFIAGLAEELGWMGYAIDPMQDRWNALQAGLLLGLFGAVCHIAPLAQAGRSPAWIAWQSLFLVSSRVLYVWLYNNTGQSVFAAAFFHDTLNVSWQLFPNAGSHYDPAISGLTIAAVAAVVTVVWGSRTLARRSDRSGIDRAGSAS